MTNTDEDLWPPLRHTYELTEAAVASLVDLRHHEDETVRQIQTAFRTRRHRAATFDVLGLLQTSYTVAVLDDLVPWAFNMRETFDVRHLLGRLPYRQAEELVPLAVRQALETKTNVDGDDYRRMAELLRHLGLYKALRDLCREAQDSIDPDIREVAEDFAEYGTDN